MFSQIQVYPIGAPYPELTLIESGENTGTADSVNAGSYVLRAGDAQNNRQYIAFLHFKTAGLPDNAVVTALTLRLKRSRFIGVESFTVLGDLQVDIAKPFFETGAGLVASDFQASASAVNVGSFNPVPLTDNWYEATLDASAFPLINLTGTPQFSTSKRPPRLYNMSKKRVNIQIAYCFPYTRRPTPFRPPSAWHPRLHILPSPQFIDHPSWFCRRQPAAGQLFSPSFYQEVFP